MNSFTSKIPPSIVGIILVLIGGFTFGFSYGLYILFNSQAQAPSTLPVWYRILNAVMSMVIGILYLWLSRMVYTRHPTTRLLILSISTANILFSLTRLPSGLVPLALNLVIVGLVSTKDSRAWLQTASQ